MCLCVLSLFFLSMANAIDDDDDNDGDIWPFIDIRLKIDDGWWLTFTRKLNKTTKYQITVALFDKSVWFFLYVICRHFNNNNNKSDTDLQHNMHSHTHTHVCAAHTYSHTKEMLPKMLIGNKNVVVQICNTFSVISPYQCGVWSSTVHSE